MYSLDPGKDHNVVHGKDVDQLTSRLHSARPCIRVCRTPDKKRTVAAWMLYSDVNEKYPLDQIFEIPKTPRPPPYEIRQIEGKGRGMITTRMIKYGELIVRERPVIMAPVMQLRDAKSNWWSMTACFLQLLYRIDQEDREKVVQLSNCKPLDEYGPLAGLYLTNSLAAEFPWSQICPYYGALCLVISYVNHSCDQNAHYYFDEESIIFSLRATRDISAGEEVTIGYIEGDLPRAERQRELRVKYSFKCTCRRCSAPADVSATSDRRRRFVYDTLDTLDDIAKRWQTCAPRDRAMLRKCDLETVQALLHAIDEEKLQTRRIEALRQLAFMYAVISDLENFRNTAGECLRALEATRGWREEDAKWYSTWEGWMRNPKSFPAWGLWA